MEVGRSSSAEAEAVSAYLRRGSDEILAGRRRVAVLSLAAAGALGVVSLYQLGIVEHLPEPPFPFLDSEQVDASGEAYAFLKVPDATTGLASYAGTLVLAAIGGKSRSPWLGLALAAKVAADAAGGALLTLEQATKHRKFCLYCLAAAGASFASVPAVLPEARTAWRRLRR